jgi:EmrB/QacA subfamily drug resistance transporter
MGSEEQRLEIGPVAFLVAALMFMEFLDGSIIPTAAPAIARSFKVLSSQIGICVTVYMVTIVVCIPLSAWLADKFGVRLVLFLSIAIFTVASLFCALSSNLIELTTMRIIQGLGAASMVPVGRLILMRSVDKSEVIRVISYSVWPALAAPVVAPVLGGFLVSRASWHWIFLVNIPIGIFAFLVGLRIVPEISREETKPLDWLGLAGVGVSLGVLVFAAANLGAPHINVILTSILLIVGLVVGLPTIFHLRRDANPLIDLTVLEIQTFRLNSLSGLLFRLAQNTAPFVLPLLFQERFGWSAQRAGSILFFYMAGNLSFKAFTTPLMERFRFKPLILLSTLLSIPLTLTLALLTPSLPFFVIALLLLITGGVRSIGMTLYNTITFADTDQERMSHANTIANMVQQLSSAAAVATAVIAIGIGRAIAGSHNQYLWSFSFAILALLLSLPSVLALPHSAGQSLRKKAYS